MIEVNELLERWTNVERVLDAMPPHERQHHWNMAVWGEQTTCGTVACAAGHCGLDPWFRERGFTLDFAGESKVMQISDVPGFFGTEGSERIFFRSEQRPVEKVISEVHEYLSELQRQAALIAGRSLPKIGEEWAEQGGIYAGPRAGKDGGPDYVLIVGPEHDGNLDWNGATAWAAGLRVGDHADFVLPNRNDGRALFDRVPQLFHRDWYWLGEQHASDSDGAWYQVFDDGYQGYWGKASKLRARAVRRLPL